MHGGAAQFFGRNFLPDGGLHKRGPGEEQTTAVGHEDVVAHHGKIPASGHTHAHDGSNLRNAHGRHDSIVAKHAAKIIRVREDIFSQRQEDSGGVNEIDSRNAIFDGYVLRTDDFLRRHGKEGPGFHGGIVHDEHDHATFDASESGDDAGGGSAAPVFVHFVRGVEA